MSLRANILGFMRDRLTRWGMSISDPAHREAIAEHAADTVEKVMLSWDDEEVQKLSIRTRVYVEREATRAYAAKFAELLEADIEAAAQRHLLATLGPRVQALEDAAKAA